MIARRDSQAGSRGFESRLPLLLKAFHSKVILTCWKLKFPLLVQVAATRSNAPKSSSNLNSCEGVAMSRGLRFPRWATRSERRAATRLRRALGFSVHRRRLAIEPLEQRTMFSTYGPLISFATWNQSGPIGNSTTNYNDYVPLDPATGTRSVTGCVPTAEVQVLYYWHFPNSISLGPADAYTSNAGSPSALDIDGDASKYNFPTLATLNSDLAAISYSGNPTEESLLVFALGIKDGAAYSAPGTAAYIDAARLGNLGFESADDSYYDWNAIEPTVIANIVAIHGGSGKREGEGCFLK